MLNHITIMGRLTADPVLRYTKEETPVSNFRLAVDRDYGKPPQTDFIDCSAWRHTAEFVQRYFSKGTAAVVSGRLQIVQYKDRDGHDRSKAEIKVDSIYFAERKQKSEKTEEKISEPVDVFAEEFEDSDGDLPY